MRNWEGLVLDVFYMLDFPHEPHQSLDRQHAAARVVLDEDGDVDGITDGLIVRDDGILILQRLDIRRHGDDGVGAHSIGVAAEHGCVEGGHPLRAQHDRDAAPRLFDNHLHALQPFFVAEGGEAAGINRPDDAVRPAFNAKVDDAPQPRPIHLAARQDGRRRYRKYAAIGFSHDFLSET